MVRLKVEPNMDFFENYLGSSKSSVPEYQKFYAHVLEFLATNIEPNVYTSITDLEDDLGKFKSFVLDKTIVAGENVTIPEKCMEKLVIEGDKIGFSPMRTDSGYEYRSGKLIELAYIKVLE